MSTIFLVRHGETDWNVQRRFQGQTDIPLNAMGIAQANATAQYLKRQRFVAAYSSDLQRARFTAETIVAEHPLALAVDERLREIHFGKWEGWTSKEIKEKDPDDYQRWLADPSFRPEGAETGEQMTSRVASFVTFLRETHDDDDHVLVVAHGGTLQILSSLALNIPPGMRWRFAFHNASVSKLYLFAERATLASLNIEHFLEDIDPKPYEAQAQDLTIGASI